MNKIERFLAEYPVTQKELAEHLNISLSYLRKLLNNQRNLSDVLQDRLKALEKQYSHFYDLDCKVDWLNIQFNTLNVKGVVEDIFGIRFGYFEEKRTGEFGYKWKYTLDKLKILKSDESRPEMGSLISLSGQACRLLERYLEEQERTWFEFFSDVLANGGKFTRVDLAIDDYAEYFSLVDVLGKVERDELVTSFKTIQPHYDITYSFDENGKRVRLKKGISIYFGTRLSKLQIIFYQKNYELAKRQNKSVEEFAVKNRYELRFKETYANDVIRELLKRDNVYDVTLGIMAQKITFLNRDMQTVWQSWELLLKDVKKIKLTTEPAVKNYEKMKRYLEKGFGRTLKAMLEIDELNGTTVVQDMLEELELDSRYEDVITVSQKDLSRHIPLPGSAHYLRDMFDLEKHTDLLELR